jgi:hypothetical protein
MKNDQVQIGQAYAWSRHRPERSEKGVRVTALALETVKVEGDFPRSPGRRLAMVRVRWEEDKPVWGRREERLSAGSESHVPARELWGPYEERAKEVDAIEATATEAGRLRQEIIESLVALGIVTEKHPRVYARVEDGPVVAIEVAVIGAAEAQRLSDALSFAIAGRAS